MVVVVVLEKSERDSGQLGGSGGGGVVEEVLRRVRSSSGRSYSDCDHVGYMFVFFGVVSAAVECRQVWCADAGEAAHSESRRCRRHFGRDGQPYELGQPYQPPNRH